MDLTLTEEQELVSSTAREFLTERAPLDREADPEAESKGYSPSLWKEMSDLGWMGMAIPEEHGGYGATFLELCLVIEQLGAHLVPGPFLPSVAVAASVIAEHGSEDLKASRLPGIASGERIVTYVRDSRDAGGVIVEGDDANPALMGTADFVPFSAEADELLVIARHRHDPSARSAYLIPSGAVDHQPLTTVGPTHHSRVRFEEVEADPGSLVGSRGSGHLVSRTLDHHGTAATCAEMVGGAQSVLDMTVTYATERDQFGAPIGTFQAIQHKCADMGVDVLTSRLIAYEAIWRLSEGLDADREVTMAKAWVSDAYRRVCAAGHQVHGAIGFTAEHSMHRFLSHAVARELEFGDGDEHWAELADLLDLPG